MPCGETYFTHNILIPLLFTSPNGHTSMANRDTYRYTLKRGNQIVYVGITNQQNRFFHLPPKPMLRVRLLVGLVLGLSALTGQGVPPPTPKQPVAVADTTFDQAVALEQLRRQIAGREQEPAEAVFQNIQMMKGMPAGRLLRVMEMGYSRSLGVTCVHCHVPEAWEKEDKPTKQIARDMAAMVRTINEEHLKNIRNLKSERPTVNCTTCHRGQTKPALDLPPG